MDRIWERSLAERRQTQEGQLRELLIGYYAPREPLVMEKLHRFLQHEKKYPLGLVHKVIDRLAGMSISTTVVTHGEAMEFIQGIPDDFAIARGPCACRLRTAQIVGPDARDLSSGRLGFCAETPLDVDIQIAKCGEKFGELPSYAPISKAALLDLEEECFRMGLVANIYVMMGGEAGICHCSSTTCVPFLANEAMGGASRVVRRGAFVARTDKAACKATGDCAQVCHFGARRIVDEGGERLSRFDPARCYGCGFCATVCPEKAITMVPRRA